MNRTWAWGLIGIAIVILVAFGVFAGRKMPAQSSNPPPVSISLQTISNGTITAAFPPADFGLATNDTQVLVHPYIPPCTPGFDYCLYYIGTAYTGTNFESAGIRIEKRPDLGTKEECLDTPPSGFDASMMPTATSSADAYSASVFGNVGDAGAGHYASGSLYRLYLPVSSSCYEFETRIGQTQFANYPAGTIKEFTSADEAALAGQLKSILDSVTLTSGAKVSFP